MERVTYLDGWRGLAILGVLFGHFVTGEVMNLGRFGVELFFVLSGRLMAEILFVRGTPLRAFFPRRFARIYPVLFIFVTASFVALRQFSSTPLSVAEYVFAVTLTQNYAVPGLGARWEIQHLWSLCVEEHLYLLLGLIAALHRRFKLPVGPILLSLAAVAWMNGAIQTALGLDYYLVYWRSDVRGASILLGAFAYMTLRDRPAPSWTPVVLGLVGFALNLNFVPDPIKYGLGTSALAGAVALLPRAGPVVRTALSDRRLVYVGVLSYSLYVWQQPFYVMADTHGSRPMWLGVAILVGLASFYLLEGPSRRLINGLSGRLRQPGSRTAVAP